MAQSTSISEIPPPPPPAQPTPHPSDPTASTTADAQGRSPLYLAATTGNIALIKSLLPTSNIHLGILHTPETPLHAAATHGHATTVTLLLTAGAHVNGPDAFSRTPLMRAVLADRISVVQTLLDWQGEESVDLNAVDVQGETALMKAAVWGREEIVMLLLGAGGDLGVCEDEDGGKAGMHAAAWGKEGVVRLLLLKKGGGGGEGKGEKWWDMKDRQGRTAVEIAERRGKMGVVQLLRGWSDRES